MVGWGRRRADGGEEGGDALEKEGQRQRFPVGGRAAGRFTFGLYMDSGERTVDRYEDVRGRTSRCELVKEGVVE